MKRVQLKDVMQRLRVVVTDTGYELHSEAGTAKYDGWGERREVNGIPEYFPLRLSVDSKEKAGSTPVRSGASDVQQKMDGIIKAIVDNATQNNENLKQQGGTISYKSTMTVPVGEIWLPMTSIRAVENAVVKPRLSDGMREAGNEAVTDGIRNELKHGSINLTVSVTTSSDYKEEALKKAIQEAAERAASEGAKRARDEMLKDFHTRGPKLRDI